MKTENVFRIVDGVVGGLSLLGAVAGSLALFLGDPVIFPAWLVVVFTVSNLAFATVNLTRAISYDTRLMLVTYAVMTLSLSWWFGSTGFVAVLVAVFFAGGFLEGACSEANYRRQWLQHHKATRASKPGRRGVIHRTPSSRLRSRGATGLVRWQSL